MPLLKLRYGWGQNGNSSIDAYASYQFTRLRTMATICMIGTGELHTTLQAWEVPFPRVSAGHKEVIRI